MPAGASSDWKTGKFPGGNTHPFGPVGDRWTKTRIAEAYTRVKKL
jgi:hypothetical protein